MSRVLFRVVKGGLQPADDFAVKEMRKRQYSIGDLVTGDIRKPRNPQFHRKAHAVGQFCIENTDRFENHDAHAVIKRLQLETGLECDETAVCFDGKAEVSHRVPRSLSFASMSEEAFSVLYNGICNYLSKTYFQGMSKARIDRAVELIEGRAR